MAPYATPEGNLQQVAGNRYPTSAIKFSGHRELLHDLREDSVPSFCEFQSTLRTLRSSRSEAATTLASGAVVKPLKGWPGPLLPMLSVFPNRASSKPSRVICVLVYTPNVKVLRKSCLPASESQSGSLSASDCSTGNCSFLWLCQEWLHFFTVPRLSQWKNWLTHLRAIDLD